MAIARQSAGFMFPGVHSSHWATSLSTTETTFSFSMVASAGIGANTSSASRLFFNSALKGASKLGSLMSGRWAGFLAVLVLRLTCKMHF